MVKEYSIEVPSMQDLSMDNLIKYIKAESTKDADTALFSAFGDICNIPKDVMLGLTFKDATAIHAAVQKSLKYVGTLRRSFTLNGVTYGMIPNIEHVTVGEYADLDTYLTPLFAGEIKHEQAFKFMAVMFRPIIEGSADKLYKIEKYNGTDGKWQIMKQAPADVYVNTVSFFLTLRKDLLNSLRTYLMKELAKEKDKDSMPQQEVLTEQSGVGLLQLIHLQKEVLLDGMKQLNFHLPKLSHSSRWQKI